jgi:protein-S-isoprenylcysteine O-methyltransferase Ste14
LRTNRVGAQFAALAGVAFPPEQLHSLGVLLGAGSIVGGVAVAALGVQSLGNSLSPFPVPSRSNTLVTDGIYATGARAALCAQQQRLGLTPTLAALSRTVRHPMYTGLILASFGASLASGSFARMVFTVALAAVLNAKADLEEAKLQARLLLLASLRSAGGQHRAEQCVCLPAAVLSRLQEMHAGYADYAAGVPRLVPALPVVTPALRSAALALADWVEQATHTEKVSE